MINPITSIADLLFKVKTEIPYQHLLIVSVRGIWSHLANEVQSIESAIKIIDDYCAIVHECSALVSNINAYRNRVNDPADEEFNKLFVLKDRRADTAADDARPSMRFNGENLTINNSYQRTAEEYERMRHRNYSNQNTYIVTTQQNSQTFSYALPDTDYEILERRGMTPTGERITVCRRVPRNIPHGIRRELEDEMWVELEQKILEAINNSRRVNVRLHEDDDVDDDHEYFYRRPIRINEDNPNNDR